MLSVSTRDGGGGGRDGERAAEAGAANSEYRKSHPA